MKHTHYQQKTIAKPVSCQGVGVHSGRDVTLTIKPAPANHGIKFFRVDLPASPGIPALFSRVVDTSLATVIGEGGVIVSTIEHLMAAFSAFSIDNAIVELNSYEMPIMDGSAAAYCDMIKEAGLETQDAQRVFFVVNQPVEIEENGKFVGIYPHEGIKLSCTVEYESPVIGRQELSLDLTPELFAKEIGPARTFGFLFEYDYLKKFGLARGASLDSAIVIDGEKIVNEGGLRFPDEFVRHKVLDCIGDFSLLGMPLSGHIVVRKSGHAFNHAFLNRFFSSKASWKTMPLQKLAS